MTDTIEIDDDTDIDTLTTLLEAKTGDDYLPAEAIRAAVAYWLENHEVAECDGTDDSTRVQLEARRGRDIGIGPDTEIGERPFYDDPTPVFDHNLTFPGRPFYDDTTDENGRVVVDNKTGSGGVFNP